MEPVDESKPEVDNLTVDLKSGLEPWNGKEVTSLRYAKLYIKDILGMHDAGSGVFMYKDHPIVKVDILGINVQVLNKEKLTIYSVDDGTGVINCCCFKQNFAEESLQSLGKLQNFLKCGSLRSVADAMYNHQEKLSSTVFQVGELLHIRGNLKSFRNEIEIRADFHDVVTDPNVETMRMLEQLQIYRVVYDKPLDNHFRPKSQITSEIKFHRNVSKEILDYLRLNKIETFTEKDLKENVALVSHPTKEATDLLRKVLDELCSSGFLLKDLLSKQVFHSVEFNSRLHDKVKKIIQERTDCEVSWDGCEFTTIYREIRSMAAYSQMNKSTLEFCLRSLENNSDILCVSDKRYMVVA